MKCSQRWETNFIKKKASHIFRYLHDININNGEPETKNQLLISGSGKANHFLVFF